MALKAQVIDTVANSIGLLDISALGTLAEYRIGAALQFDAPAQYNTRATPSSAGQLVAEEIRNNLVAEGII